jgi:formylglycine-generating enzyme required for sulfatase activity
LVSWNGKAAAGIWCANRYHHYPAYQAPPDPLLEPFPTDREGITLRGGCLHTQAVLRRTTSRIMGLPEERNLFAGTRLVMPPGRAAWE